MNEKGARNISSFQIKKALANFIARAFPVSLIFKA